MKVDDAGKRVIFGAGGLHRLQFASQRQLVLSCALDAGFRAFDVAPAYGNGLNELELGRALGPAHHEYRVATKFGIPIDPYGERHPHIFIGWRLMNKLKGTNEYNRRAFDPIEMQRSLEGSLRRLRRDYIDDFFIHEPLVPLTEEEAARLHEKADNLKKEGKIRSWGIAAPVSAMGSLASDPRVDVVQFPLDDLVAAGSAVARRRIAYGVFGRYSRERTGESFLTWLQAILNRSPTLEVILATKSRETLREFATLLR